jgi:ribosome-associated toxin RatA of RatAB toxin-antitoxin module
MAGQMAERSAVVRATPQACFDAITDYESFPDWQSAVRSVEVRTRDDLGRGVDVEFVIDVRVRRVRYVLRYAYDEPQRISWDYVEGDLRSIAGDYRFEDLGDGTTRATYRVELDPGRFVPGPVKKLLTDLTMQRSVDELKERAEAS